MNKKLVLMGALALALTLGTNAGFCEPPKDREMPPCFDKGCMSGPMKQKPDFKNMTAEERTKMQAEFKTRQEKMKQEFDAKLGLTEEQKEKAQAIREKGHKEMKPIMDEMMKKRQEIRKVRESRITKVEQDKKIKELREEMKPLKQKADSLRKANMQEFESILTKEQKKKFEQIKKEGKKNCAQNRKKHQEMQKKHQQMHKKHKHHTN